MLFLVFGFSENVMAYKTAMIASETLVPEKVSKDIETAEEFADKLDLTLLGDAMVLVARNHLNRNNFDFQKLSVGIVQGFMQSLDKHSYFVETKEAEMDQEIFSGNIGGIGATLVLKKRYVVLSGIIPDSPAEKAGLKPGDKIFEINGKLMKDKGINEVAKNTRGMAGTRVNLKILRKGIKTPITFNIERAMIEVKTVSWTTIEFSGKIFGVIKIDAFNQNTAVQFEQVVEDLLKKEPDYIIFDLRNNLGGIMYIVEEMLGRIVGEDKIIYQEERSDGFRLLKLSYNLKHETIFGTAKKPIKGYICLVNDFSASSAEIMSAAFRDVLGMKLVGEKTYGKGTGWSALELPSGKGVCYITELRWFTPKGVCIDGVGLEPDIEVEMDEEDIYLKKDPQMDAAIEELLNNK